MRVGSVRVFVITTGSLFWLAGCETWNNGLSSQGPGIGAATEATGSITVLPPPDLVDGRTPASTGLQGDNLKDDLNLGKKHYRENSFGLAEQHFRRAVEQGPRNVEAWTGLAASYDKLKRFDLADRAYEQAIKLVGPTAEILNNQGYSYLLRGDHRRARAKLLAAQAKDPSNPYIQNNLALLDESFAKRRGVQ
jgi:Tfp pilus assembly protein PilF